MKMAYIDKLEDSLEKKVIVEQARKFPETIRQRMGMWKTATAYALAAMIGFGALTGCYSKNTGVSFGKPVVAGEVKKEYRGLPGLSEYKLVKVLELDKFKEIAGKDTILRRYVHKVEGRNKMIATYEFNNKKIWSFVTKNGKEVHFYNDPNADGNFETEGKTADIKLENYGY